MNKIILVGNPNAGKSTVFNFLTKSKAKTGNWHGVTVGLEKGEAIINGQKYEVFDVPGFYGMTPYSPEERVSVEAVLGFGEEIFLNVVDINNLERSLNLTLQLLELGLKVIVIFNLMGQNGKEKEYYKKVGEKLGVLVCFFDFKKGIEGLKDIENTKSSKKLNYIKRYKIENKTLCEKNNFVRKIESEDSVDEIFDLRRNFLVEILEGDKSKKKEDKNLSKHKLFFNGFFVVGIFLLFMLLTFYVTFGPFGSFLSELVEKFVNFFAILWNDMLKLINAPLFVCSFFEIVISGVGGVLCFLPQVMLLFLAMQFLEQSGFLGRIAWVLDPIMSKIGLGGRSVFSILMGFGCTTTALPTTVVLKDDRERIKTSLFLSFISCSAKLPIFACIAGAFFGNFSVFVIFGLYILGIICGIIGLLIAQIFYPSVQKKEVLEFGNLTLPKFRNVFKDMWGVLLNFVKKIATIILIFTIILWFLNNFTIDFRFITGDETSILSILAGFIAPIFSPLGFDSGAVIAIIIGLVAKEMVISSIAVLNGANEGNLAESLLSSSSVVNFDVYSAISFMVFCLLYTPCISALAQLKHCVHKKVFWGFLIGQFVLAYVVSYIVLVLIKSFAVFNVGQILWAILLTIVFVVVCFYGISHFVCKKKGCNGCNFCNKL